MTDEQVNQIPVERLIADVVQCDIHPDEVCRILEAMLNEGHSSLASYQALSACRAVMCRLDPTTLIPAVPKWV